MSAGITDFFVHTVSVETYAGSGAYGDVYNAPVDVTGYLDGKITLVRGKDGQQVVASSTFYCSTTDAALFPPDSRVTAISPGTVVPGDATQPDPNLYPSTAPARVSHVITQNVNDAPGLLDEVAHGVIYLK